jgi:PAS domain S-box-containing protein
LRTVLHRYAIAAAIIAAALALWQWARPPEWLAVTVFGVMTGALCVMTQRIRQDGARLVEECWRGERGRDQAERQLAELQERLDLAQVDLEKHRRLEETWRDTQDYYHRIFDQAAVGIARLSLDRTVLDVNPGLCEMLGFEQNELIGRNLLDLIHPDDAGPVGRALRGLCEADSENLSLALRLRHRDPVHLWAQTTLSPIRDASGQPRSLVTVVRDITVQLHTEATLRFLAEASALLSAVADHRDMLSRLARLAVPDFADWCAVDLVDAAGGLERLTVAGEVPTGAVAMVGGPACVGSAPLPQTHPAVARVVRSRQPQWIPALTEWTRSSALPVEELGGLRELGFKSYLSVPLAVHGRVAGALSFALVDSGRRYDDGDLAAAQDLAHRVGTAMENAELYQELRIADRRKDEFLATLGHELRNPLVPIRSGIDLLAMESGPTEVTTLMRQQVEHLARLVDDLLDVSRIARGRVELRREPIPLSKIVERAAAAMRGPLAALEQVLAVHVSEDDPWLDVDPVRLVQVVENLLQNASKFTGRGGSIEVEGRRENDVAVLVVRDSGIGIEPEVLPHIFEPFTQSPRSQLRGGLGIGLALVRGLVEMHDGTVTASSGGVGAGSEFLVRLPVAEDAPAPVARAATTVPRRQTRNQTRKGRNILVVDDNLEGARMLELLLATMGPHRIAVAHDGPSALEQLASFAPEIVLLDIGLPGMDGHQVGRRMRQDEEHGGVLLVALTGYGQEEDRRRSRQAGFDAHLVKPPSIEDLERLLDHPKLVALATGGAGTTGGAGARS